MISKWYDIFEQKLQRSKNKDDIQSSRRIYCSPIERAKDTLELFELDKKIPVIIENRIKERNMGIYEKIPFEQLKWNEFWNYNSDKLYPEDQKLWKVYMKEYQSF